jgi:hypothetical protein
LVWRTDLAPIPTFSTALGLIGVLGEEAAGIVKLGR